MPLSKKRQAEWMKDYRRRRKAQKRKVDALAVTGIMSSADVRAMRKGGLKSEDIENETGKVSSRLYYALLRDRDAIKGHLSWHHDMIGKPDVGTMIEQLSRQVSGLQARVTLLEAGLTVAMQEGGHDPERFWTNWVRGADSRVSDRSS